jgi:hypothetical protein
MGDLINYSLNFVRWIVIFGENIEYLDFISGVKWGVAKRQNSTSKSSGYINFLWKWVARKKIQNPTRGCWFLIPIKSTLTLWLLIWTNLRSRKGRLNDVSIKWRFGQMTFRSNDHFGQMTISVKWRFGSNDYFAQMTIRSNDHFSKVVFDQTFFGQTVFGKMAHD